MATAKPTPAKAQPPVLVQPQSKHQAAQDVGMCLANNDTWAQAYFNSNDLHYSERVLFG